MKTWLIIVPMVGAAAIIGVPTVAVILLTGPNDEDDSARADPTLCQPAVSEPETPILNVAIADDRTPERLEPVPAETGAVFVLQLPEAKGDARCLAAAV